MEESSSKRCKTVLPVQFFDSHFHVWDVSSAGPHSTEAVFEVGGEPLYGVARYEAEINAARTEGLEPIGGVFVEACPRDPKFELKWAACELAHSNRPYLLIPHADLEKPDVGDLLVDFAKDPRVRGVRQILNFQPNIDPYLKDDQLQCLDWERGFSLLGKHGLSFELQCNPHQYAKAAEVIARHPNVVVILNHLGTPQLSDLADEAEQYRRGMQALAALPNVYLKVSFLCRIHKQWSEKKLVLDMVHEMLCLFGISRCMFASNFPVDNHLATMGGWGMARLAKAMRDDIGGRYGDAALKALFAETAMRVYRLHRDKVPAVLGSTTLRIGRPGLVGQGCVVTGASAGLGAAIATVLALDGGARVVVADINEGAGEAVAAAVRARGGKAEFFKTDVTNDASVSACMAHCVDRFGSLRVLVNNAVRFVFGHLKGAGNGSKTGTDRDIEDADWDTVFQVNVCGYARCIKHAMHHMRKNELTNNCYWNDQGEGTTFIHAGSRGSIVNVASISSFIAQPEFVPYNASKGAVLQLSKCCAMDLASDKVRVNAVCPGTIETPGAYNHMRLIGVSLEQGRTMFADGNLLKRQSAPEEIANAVMFLASDDSSFVTGAHFAADGGQTIGG
eukprot:TRINITY_DN62657_c0_g1_i1.p1 TRINITY_DN62657_c0_g1~~TRINITY_DN62657_c0_g1_i1.p1  ORF type:complete len:619 (-),score=95.85 TRINITY_DN62657_c0_g1_i1:339-2195(-)